MTEVSSNKTYLLVLDVGTHAVRAACFCGCMRGAVVEQTIALEHFDDGRIEQNPDAIINALNDVMKQVAPRGIAFEVALVVQRSSVLAWQQSTVKPLSAVISWQDTRGAKVIDGLSSSQKKHIQALSGLVPSAHYSATKIALLQAKYSKTVTKGDFMVGPLGSWLAAKLLASGKALCDPTLAARTQLWDIDNQLWSHTLAHYFDCDITCLPAVLPSVAHYGKLRDFNAHLSLLLGDQNAAFIGLSRANARDQQAQPVTFKSPLVVNVGSGAFVLAAMTKNTLLHNQKNHCTQDYNLQHNNFKVPQDRNLKAPQGLLRAVVYSARLNNQSSNWLNSLNSAALPQASTHQQNMWEATVNAAGTLLSDWQALHFNEMPTELFFAQLEAWASNEMPACIYLPLSKGVAAPFWLPKQASVYLSADGEAVLPTLPQQGVALLESIVFLLSINIECMRKGAIEADGIILAGGLSRSKAIALRLYVLTGLELFVPSDHEATLTGAAVLVGEVNNGENLYDKNSFRLPILDGYLLTHTNAEYPAIKCQQLHLRYQQFKAYLEQLMLKPCDDKNHKPYAG